MATNFAAFSGTTEALQERPQRSSSEEKSAGEFPAGWLHGEYSHSGFRRGLRW